MTVPDEWAARVMEALIVRGLSFSWTRQDEVVSAVLLEMRIGQFEDHNKNLFKRYSSNLFRCYVCNAVIDGAGGANASTVPHLQLHRNQVMGVLAPDSIFRDNSWECTRTPAWEEIECLDRELERQQRSYLASFDVISKERP